MRYIEALRCMRKTAGGWTVAGKPVNPAPVDPAYDKLKAQMNPPAPAVGVSPERQAWMDGRNKAWDNARTEWFRQNSIDPGKVTPAQRRDVAGRLAKYENLWDQWYERNNPRPARPAAPPARKTTFTTPGGIPIPPLSNIRK